MNTDELKILLALEWKWTVSVVSVTGLEFLTLPSSEISIQDSLIQFGRYTRRILGIEWLRPNVVRLRTRQKFQSRQDVVTLYPGERLPSTIDLRRRRRDFQTQLGRALCSYFGARSIERQTLYSDKRHGIGGAYPRFLVGKRAAIAVDPDEPSVVINGIMRAAMFWSPLVRRRVSVVVPFGRHQTIASRLRTMTKVRETFDWLHWNGSAIVPFVFDAEEPETHVQQFHVPSADAGVERILALAPGVLQAVPHIAGRAISIRLRGIEVARVTESGTAYPLGEPVEAAIREVDQARRYRSSHPLARAHEERWLESNLIGQIRQVLPGVAAGYIYPQVPSFAGEERSIIDLLTVTEGGRLVVIEIKASADPDLPFQALDYWIAVERHRKAGDFVKKGYFAGCTLVNQPAILVLVAPLLAYHKAVGKLISGLPGDLPLVEIGINQTWKREIKVLRRRGLVG